jgi:UDP-glucose 4-epimerase
MFDRAVVTGGAGFIGSALTDYLLERDVEVTVLDNFSLGSKSNLASSHKNLKVVNADVCNQKQIEPFIKQADIVFDFAAIVGVEIATKLPLEVLDTNIESARSVLQASLDSNVKKIVFTSSSEVYGNSMADSVTEDMPLSPISPYGVSKIVGENYLKAYWEKYGLKSSIVRYFNVYGPKQSTKPLSFVVPSFIYRALHHEPLKIYGSGGQTRDCTYISDAVEGTYQVAERGREEATPYNICTNVETSITDLAELVCSTIGNGCEISYTGRRTFDIARRRGDFSKAQKEVGYKPKVELKEGVRRTVEYYRNLLIPKIRASSAE